MAKQKNHGTFIWPLYDLLKHVKEMACKPEGSDQWIPCRPLGWTVVSYRLRAMKLVWQGKADVVVWPGDQ